MESKAKFKLRKKLKRHTKIYNIFLITGIALFVSVFIALSMKIDFNNIYIKAAIIAIMPLITVGLFSGVYAQITANDLYIYKKKIKAYRERRHMLYIMKLLMDKNYLKAIDHYNSMNSGSIKDFLYSFMLGILTTCDDQIRVERANQTLQETLNEFSPDNVFN